jgi:hypothetical protein
MEMFSILMALWWRAFFFRSINMLKATGGQTVTDRRCEMQAVL